MARCSCAGNTCACSIVAGTGISVTGIGTAANPFRIALDATSISVGDRLAVSSTTSVALKKVGAGTTADKLVLSADVRLVSPDGRAWGLAVSNSGVVSGVAV